MGIGVVDYALVIILRMWARAQVHSETVPPGVLFVNRANFYSAYLMIGLFVVLDYFHGRIRLQLMSTYLWD